MAVEFKLHDVGEGIDAAEVVEWRVAVGDQVREDQPLADVQTDKAVVEIPCPTDGVVLELRWQPGDMVPVGEVLAVFGEASELDPAAAQPEMAEVAEITEGAPAPSSPPGASNGGGTVTADLGEIAVRAAGERPLASPAVRALARERGVDHASVSGSGPSGRVLREDVERGPEPAGAPAPAAPAQRGEDEVVPLRGTRRAIARNLTRSWREIPHIVDFREVDATRLLEARRTLREMLEVDGEQELAATLTPLALVAKVAATTARRHPRANASIDLEAEEITLRGAVNLSIAIDAPDGLVTPVVRNADRKPAPAIGAEIAALAAAARERKLTPEQFAGGTMTVNNFGSLGSPFSTPLIPVGQAVNLGLGRITERPLAVDGEVVVRPVLGISCSGDHRILDGADLSRFVNDVVAAIADPIRLLAELA
jgi:pyruvate dehydrogenase E2 component (dihydrolipoamide acetyltransferase)